MDIGDGVEKGKMRVMGDWIGFVLAVFFFFKCVAGGRLCENFYTVAYAYASIL